MLRVARREYVAPALCVVSCASGMPVKTAQRKLEIVLQENTQGLLEIQQKQQQQPYTLTLDEKLNFS